jgi:hypothetical protein
MTAMSAFICVHHPDFLQPRLGSHDIMDYLVPGRFVKGSNWNVMQIPPEAPPVFLRPETLRTQYF